MNAMKKILFVMALCVSALAMTGCKGEPGRDGRDGLVNYYNIPVQVNQNEWSYSNFDNNNYFYAIINMPEITWEIYQHANVMVYREYDQGTDAATQTPLPYTRHHEYLFDEASGTWGFYTETVDYEYTKGKMTIFYTASDFDYEMNNTFVPEQMNFRVFIMY